MATPNCWEARKCGREPGGQHADELGVCPAATFEAADGFLGGRNGGKACCFITGTFCDETVQGAYRDKSKRCWDCSFYQRLRSEHGAAFSVPGFVLYLSERDRASFRAFVEDNRQGTG